jgi:hypothetical protein
MDRLTGGEDARWSPLRAIREIHTERHVRGGNPLDPGRGKVSSASSSRVFAFAVP